MDKKKAGKMKEGRRLIWYRKVKKGGTIIRKIMKGEEQERMEGIW